MAIELKKNTRYQANITLGTLESFANNELVAAKLRDAGFVNVVVLGTGKQRTATGLWPKETVNVTLPQQVIGIKEL